MAPPVVLPPPSEPLIPAELMADCQPVPFLDDPSMGGMLMAYVEAMRLYHECRSRHAALANTVRKITEH